MSEYNRLSGFKEKVQCQTRVDLKRRDFGTVFKYQAASYTMGGTEKDLTLMASF